MQDRTAKLIYLHNPRIKQKWADPGTDAKADLKKKNLKKKNGLAIFRCSCKKITSLNYHY